jgi:hypothetical protein
MSDYKSREMGVEAERVLRSDAYQEAWSAYRTRIFELMEQAKDKDTVWELHRRLTVLAGVQGHIERLMKEGKIAAANIESEEKRGFLKRVIG